MPVLGATQIALISTVSAVIGGLAVSWWHRKTLSKLQNSVNSEDIQKTVHLKDPAAED